MVVASLAPLALAVLILPRLKLTVVMADFVLIWRLPFGSSGVVGSLLVTTTA
jgi:hypothetical protein